MTDGKTTLPLKLVEHGAALYDAPISDALAVLGIQAEAVEINLRRSKEGRAIPGWSDDTAFDRVLLPQRASASELADYTRRGLAFAHDLIEKLRDGLIQVLCRNGEVRSEILAFEGDTKEAIKYTAGVVTGLVAAYFPAVVATAAVAIATTLAVIFLKKNLHKFCLTSSLDLS